MHYSRWYFLYKSDETIAILGHGETGKGTKDLMSQKLSSVLW